MTTTTFRPTQAPQDLPQPHEGAEIDEDILLLFIDLFCGAGGTTHGFEEARSSDGKKIAKTIVCINHDEYAIKSHKANHPECHHFTEDIRKVKMKKVKRIVDRYRKLYPNAKIVVWASAECTHLSNAKGGLSRDADSRSLANYIVRYVKALEADLLMVENVREFYSWGPLDKKGKIIKEKKGQFYFKWVNRIMNIGYDYNHTILDSADFGVPQNRKRYYGIFSKKGSGIPTVFPQPTHSKNSLKGDLFSSGLSPWVPVKSCLDLSNEGLSIFDDEGRGKALVDATILRVADGLKKNIMKPLLSEASEEPIENRFVMKYYKGVHNHSHIKSPCGTLRTKDSMALTTVHWVDSNYSGKHNHKDINLPSPTLLTNQKHYQATAHFMYDNQYSNKGRTLDRPSPTLIARMDKTPKYLVKVEGGGYLPKILPTDSEARVELKKYMIAHGISDIKLRGFEVPELLLIMGLPRDYILLGGKTRAVKFIGNAVTPPISKAWTERLYNEIRKLPQYAIAA